MGKRKKGGGNDSARSGASDVDTTADMSTSIDMPTGDGELNMAELMGGDNESLDRAIEADAALGTAAKQIAGLQQRGVVGAAEHETIHVLRDELTAVRVATDSQVSSRDARTAALLREREDLQRKRVAMTSPRGPFDAAASAGATASPQVAFDSAQNMMMSFRRHDQGFRTDAPVHVVRTIVPRIRDEIEHLRGENEALRNSVHLASTMTPARDQSTPFRGGADTTPKTLVFDEDELAASTSGTALSGSAAGAAAGLAASASARQAAAPEPKVIVVPGASGSNWGVFVCFFIVILLLSLLLLLLAASMSAGPDRRRLT